MVLKEAHMESRTPLNLYSNDLYIAELADIFSRDIDYDEVTSSFPDAHINPFIEYKTMAGGFGYLPNKGCSRAKLIPAAPGYFASICDSSSVQLFQVDDSGLKPTDKSVSTAGLANILDFEVLTISGDAILAGFADISSASKSTLIIYRTINTVSDTINIQLTTPWNDARVGIFGSNKNLFFYERINKVDAQGSLLVYVVKSDGDDISTTALDATTLGEDAIGFKSIQDIDGQSNLLVSYISKATLKFMAKQCPYTYDESTNTLKILACSNLSSSLENVVGVFVVSDNGAGSMGLIYTRSSMPFITYCTSFDKNSCLDSNRWMPSTMPKSITPDFILMDGTFASIVYEDGSIVHNIDTKNFNAVLSFDAFADNSVLATVAWSGNLVSLRNAEYSIYRKDPKDFKIEFSAAQITKSPMNITISLIKAGNKVGEANYSVSLVTDPYEIVDNVDVYEYSSLSFNGTFVQLPLFRLMFPGNGLTFSMKGDKNLEFQIKNSFEAGYTFTNSLAGTLVQIHLTSRYTGIALQEKDGKKSVAQVSCDPKLSCRYSNTYLDLSGELASWVYASKDTRNPGTIFFDVSKDSTTVYFSKSANDSFDKPLIKAVLPEKQSGFVHIYAVINGNLDIGDQNDLYLMFSDPSTNQVRVYIASSFDLTKIDTTKPMVLVGSDVGYYKEGNAFCPRRITSCPHHDRFIEITNHCMGETPRILKFVFNGFGAKVPITLYQQKPLSNLNLINKDTVPGDILFCATGDEFHVYNQKLGFAHGTTTGNGTSIHNYQLQILGGVPGPKSGLKVHCVKEVASVVFEQEDANGNTMLKAYFGNKDANVHFNHHSTYTHDSKADFVSVYMDSLEGHSAIASIVTNGQVKFWEFALDGPNIYAKINGDIAKRDYQIEVKNPKNSATYNFSELNVCTLKDEELTVSVLKKEDVKVGTINLENLISVLGPLKSVELNASSEFNKSFIFTPRISEYKPSQTPSSRLMQREEFPNLSKVHQAGNSTIIGIYYDTTTRYPNVAIFDTTGKQLSKTVIIKSFCEHSTTGANNRSAVIVFGCHLGADYTLDAVIFSFDGQTVLRAANPYVTNRIDDISVAIFDDDSVLISQYNRFYNWAEIFSMQKDLLIKDIGNYVGEVSIMEFARLESNGVALLSLNYGDYTLKIRYYSQDLTYVDSIGKDVGYTPKSINCFYNECATITYSNEIIYFNLICKEQFKPSISLLTNFILPVGFENIDSISVASGTIAVTTGQTCYIYTLSSSPSIFSSVDLASPSSLPGLQLPAPPSDRDVAGSLSSLTVLVSSWGVPSSICSTRYVSSAMSLTTSMLPSTTANFSGVLVFSDFFSNTIEVPIENVLDFAPTPPSLPWWKNSLWILSLAALLAALALAVAVIALVERSKRKNSKGTEEAGDEEDRGDKYMSLKPHDNGDFAKDN